MARWQVDCRCGYHCRAWRGRGFSNQLHPHPAFLPTFDYPGVTRSQDDDGCLRPLWASKMLFRNLRVTSRTLRPCFLQSMLHTCAKALAICSNQYEIPIWREQEANCSEIWTYCFGGKKMHSRIESKQLRKTERKPFISGSCQSVMWRLQHFNSELFGCSSPTYVLLQKTNNAAAGLH